MKKAIVIRASKNPDFQGGADFLASEDDFARCFDRAVEAGFEGVQLFVERSGYLSLASDDDVARAVAQRAAAVGIQLTSLEIEPFSFSLTDDDPTVRTRGAATVRRGMELAVAWGTRCVGDPRLRRAALGCQG